jgi:thiol-disulfide isomerase/thioredoxin
VLLAGCSTSKDAVETGGSFQFVAPGGKTELTYDPPSARGTVGAVAGPSLADPAKNLALADYPGEVVVLNVWGSWCGPCRTEAPDLQFVATQSKVAVLGINVRDDAQAARDFTHSAGISYDSISDYPGRSLAGLGGVPRNVVPSPWCWTSSTGSRSSRWCRCRWRSSCPWCSAWPRSRAAPGCQQGDTADTQRLRCHPADIPGGRGRRHYSV